MMARFATFFKPLFIALVLLIPATAFAQKGNFSTILLSGSGKPINANVAVCTTGLATTAAAVNNNIVTLTMSTNPLSAGFLATKTLTVKGFTGGDTIFNGVFTIVAVNATTISYALVHANVAAGTNGTAFQTGDSLTACAPLATIYTDDTGSTTTSNPFTSGANGNVSIWATGGVYNMQYYGQQIVTTVVEMATSGGAGICGATTDIIFNNAGVCGATANLTWTPSTLSFAAIGGGNSDDTMTVGTTSSNGVGCQGDLVVNGNFCDLSALEVGAFDQILSADDILMQPNYNGAGGKVKIGNSPTGASPGNSGEILFVPKTSGVGPEIGTADAGGSPARINLPITTGVVGSFLQTDGGTPQQTSWAKPTITLKSGSGAGNYTGANTAAYIIVDQTNLCLQVTIPVGWKLSVEASGALESITAAVAQSVAISDVGVSCNSVGTTPLPGTERTLIPPAIATFDINFSTHAVIAGDGVSHGIALMAKTSNGADSWGIQNTSATLAPSLIYTLMPSN